MFTLDMSQKRWETSFTSQRHHRYCNPTNWHGDICDNFARLPHPHHPAQKCWNQTQSSGPHLPALTRNRDSLASHKPCLFLQQFYLVDSKFNSGSSHNRAPFFPAVPQQLLSGIPFIHASTCTSQHPSLYQKCHHVGFQHWNWRWFWVLIQICRFPYLLFYFVVHVIIAIPTGPSTGFHCRCPFSITRNHSGRTLFWLITFPPNEQSCSILMKNPHFLLITLASQDTEQWNANTCREVAPHTSTCTQQLSQKPSGESPDQILCILRADPRMKLRLLTFLACGTVMSTAVKKKRHWGVFG